MPQETYVTAYDRPTAKEILDMWQAEGYKTRLAKTDSGKFVIFRGAARENIEQREFTSHEDAVKIANKLYVSGVATEIVKINGNDEHPRFKLVIKKR